MHYLVTGGAGFIGSNLIRILLEQEPDARVTCIDNFDSFYSAEIKQRNIAAFTERFTLLKLDIAVIDGQQLARELAGKVDVIIHLAARAGVRPSILDPEGYQRANIIGLQHLLDFAVKEKVKQFVFASTSSVYGVNDHFPWKEDEQLLPISPYAMTKLSGEMLGHVYHKLYGLRFIALRFFTVYGPGQRPDLAIHKFTRSILLGEPIPVFGDGNTSRDYTFVDDTVQGIIAATRYDKTDFEIINLGNNETVTLNALIAAIESIIGKKAIREKFPEQPGDVPKTYADISKAQALLHYAPGTKLEDGLRKFYHWFEDNKGILLK